MLTIARPDERFHLSAQMFSHFQEHVLKRDNTLENLDAKFTLFAPVDEVFEKFVDSAKASFWMIESNVLTMLRCPLRKLDHHFVLSFIILPWSIELKIA